MKKPAGASGQPVLAFALTFTLFASPLAAQIATTGRIVGTVKDDSGGLLPGVGVELTGDQVMGVRTFTTDEKGQYRFASLPPGIYELSFTLAGFRTTKRADVRVRVGVAREEDITLTVAGHAEEVTVESSTGVVDTATTKVETHIDREWIDNTPGQRRNFFDVLVSAPGIEPGERQTANLVWPSSYGSNIDQNLYQLDGIDVSDTNNGGGRTLVSPSIDSIDSIEVLSLGAPAEYGSHEGAVFNIVTRQGTNKFQGGAAYYYQGDGLTGRNTTADFDGGNPFTRIKYNNVTAQLGGPVLKDKLWFYAAFEHLRDSSALLRVREAAGFEEFDHYLAKLTFQPKNGHKFTAMMNYDDWLSDSGRFPEQAPETATGFYKTTWTPKVDYTGALGRETAVEAQYAGFFVSHKAGAAGGGRRVVSTRFLNLDTGNVSGAPFGWYEIDQSKTSLSAKVSHHAADFLGAGHDFKFGVQWSDAPASSQGAYNDFVFPAGYGYDYSPAADGGSTRTFGAFVDDSIRVGSRLKIDAGLRYDNIRARFTDQPVLDSRGNPSGQSVRGFQVYEWNIVSPRLGFNLRLTKDGKTALKGHYGRYYRGGSTGEWVAENTRVAVYRGTWNFQTSQFENRTLFSSPLFASVDPNFKPAYTDQLAVSLERELLGSLNLAGTYVRKRGRNMSNWQDVGGIYEPLSYVDSVGAEASGRTLTLFRLVNSPADRRFLLISNPAAKTDVNAFSLNATKRMTSNWLLTTSLTVQKATSAHTYGVSSRIDGNSFGRDPNSYVNLDGLALRDRTLIGKVQILHNRLPLGFTLGVDWSYYTGYPMRRQVRVSATRLNSTVQTAPRTDDKRLPSVKPMNLRIQKDIRLGSGNARLSLLASVFNVFNSATVMRFRTDLATSALYHKPADILFPRRAMLGAKVDF